MSGDTEEWRFGDSFSPNHYIATSSAYQAQYLQFSAICGLLEQTVSAMFDVSPQALRASRRGCARISFARQSAMYLAHVVFGLSMTQVAALFDRDRTTVAHGCAVVEDRREDPVFDQALYIVESVLRHALVRRVTFGGHPK